MNLILPSQPQDRPKPGVQFAVQTDGPAVVIQIMVTSHLSADQASGLVNAIGQAAIAAKQVEQAILPQTPINLPNGIVR